MKKKTVIRIIEWIILIPLSCAAYHYTLSETGHYIENTIEIPHGNIVHVDMRTDNNIKNGSPEHPFKNINDAIDFFENNDSYKTILVRPGEYNETLELPDDIAIIGLEGRAIIKNPATGNNKTVTAGNNIFLANLELTQGKYGLFIPVDRSVTLYNVAVTHSSKWGIYNEKHSSIDSGKLAMVNSQVNCSARQGLYLQQGTFYMNNSKVSENGEEGIDLHIKMRSVIKNSEIIKNGEGGIETELGENNLVVESTVIKENGSSGINLQSFEEDATIVIRDDLIKDNTDFGVRCAIHSKIKSPYFSKMINFEGINRIYKNGKDRIDPNCLR
ncbi:MAG: right-handed parallel beta-helix repeat-containing protein [Patescibacteria group bacterium]|nr:right-handed parallel beta-helix repeat-containing protein [Patescibacteria group bacterium]